MFNPEWVVGEVLDGKFRLAEFLGEGSFGWVYSADMFVGGRARSQCAIKIIRPQTPDLREALWRELDAMSQLSHQGLVQFRVAFDVSDGPLEGALCLVMELCEGTLSKRLQAGRRLAAEEALDVAQDVAEALAWLHGQGVVHRDLKPANVFRAGDRWKLGDLGITRNMDEWYDCPHGEQRDVSQVIHFAPEHLDGQVDPASDVWSLGVLLQQCLTGVLPYTLRNEFVPCEALVNREPTIAPGLPSPFDAVVRGCLVKDPRARWTAAQVLEALSGGASGAALVVARPVAGPVQRVAEPVPSPPRSGIPCANQERAGVDSSRATSLLSIDFGTCFSSAGFVWERAAYWVKDPLTAQPHIPTSLFWNGKTFLVGQAAEHSQDKDPDSFVREFKRDLGRDEPCFLGGRSYLPEDLAAVVLRFLREEADQIATGLGAQAFTAARVAVPATYPERRRKLMIEAARQAGFASVELIDEPVAAARSYGEQLAEGETLLVYDLGGGTFDATLLRRVGQDYLVVGQPSGIQQLGGVDFDRKIYQDFLAACTDQQRELLESRDPDKRAAHVARIGVIDFCRKQKHQLSVEQEACGSLLLGLLDTDMVDYSLTRDRFNAMIAPLVDESLGLCEQMLQEAGVDASEVGRVLMVGGSCRIPFIRQSLSGRFQCPVVLAADPWLAVAAGGMVQSAPPAQRPQPWSPSPPRGLVALGRNAQGQERFQVEGGGPVLVSLPAGRFTMGSPDGEGGRFDDEIQHEVVLSRGFLLGEAPVTQAEYQAVMGSNPSLFSGNLDHPVEQVVWFEAVSFCNALSRGLGLEEAYVVNGTDVTWKGLSCPGFRLPTEAEWEYACRAGTTGARYGDLDAVAWHGGNSGSQTHPVRRKQPNGWGLYDTLGNVWEWCWDWYGTSPSGVVTDTVGSGSGSYRVARGGSWFNDALYARAAYRNGWTPGARNGNLGFRLAKSLP